MCERTRKSSFAEALIKPRKTRGRVRNVMNESISVTLRLKSRTKNREICIYSRVYTRCIARGINIDMGNGEEKVDVTGDCQNSAISHVVMLSPFKSPRTPARFPSRLLFTYLAPPRLASRLAWFRSASPWFV